MLGWTSLPNLHPAVVHFPIALLPLAVLSDLLASALGWKSWWDRVAAGLYVVAALGAGAAYWAGRQAAESLTGIAPQVELSIAIHSDWALYTLWSAGGLALIRVLFFWWFREGAGARMRVARLIPALAGLAVVGLLFWTADLGGGLVYRHGVAVADGDREEAPPRKQEHVVVDRADTPQATAEESKSESRQPSYGAMNLVVDGRQLVLLPGSYGDLQVETLIEPQDFRGEIGLVHHFRDAEAAGFFTVSTTGKATLSDVRDARKKDLDESKVSLPSREFRLAVSSVGRHLKGIIDGRVVVHGHIDPPPRGSCGLLVEGKGTIHVRSLEVTPIGSH